MKINGRTKITGIFGYPVEHTLSPAMHNAAFEDLALNYCYVPFSVHPDDLESAVKAIRALNICGVNVTVPHKERVIPLLDELNEEASFIGAVNTIVNSEGYLKGYNTDGRGFMQSLEEKGIYLDDKDVLVVGAGGASRAVCFYLIQKVKSLSVYGRSTEKLENLVADLRVMRNNLTAVRELSLLDRYHMIINATPLGLREEDALPLDPSLLKEGQIIYDLIYKETRLLKEAFKKGASVIDGTSMLLWQGAFAFELWTGKRPNVDVMRQALAGDR
ncbi:MAG: shikimate dehydrogenase [Nitrospirota bacterium]